MVTRFFPVLTYSRTVSSVTAKKKKIIILTAEWDKP